MFEIKGIWRRSFGDENGFQKELEIVLESGAVKANFRMLGRDDDYFPDVRIGDGFSFEITEKEES